MFPINALVWMSWNPAEVIISIVYIVSIIPFFFDLESPMMAGALFSFGSAIMGYIVFRREGKRESKAYTIMAFIILIAGIASFWSLGDKKTTDSYSDFEKFLCVYCGGFAGLLIGFFFTGMIEKSRQDKMIEKKIENKKSIARMSIPENASSFNIPSDEMPVRSIDGEKIIGHINKSDYNEFIYKNINKSAKNEEFTD